MVTSRTECLYGWGMYNRGVSSVFRPGNREELVLALAEIRRLKLSLQARGAGCSYGDAALNQGGAIVDLTAFKTILSFDETQGVVHAECGVTIEALWRYIFPKGYWPFVVPGTMQATIGGCAAMNVHGKNQWVCGSFGEYVTEIGVINPDGNYQRISRATTPEAFRQIIGGAGLSGIIIDLKMRVKKIATGFLQVTALSVHDLEEMLELMDGKERFDYQVGWLDCYAGAPSLGRGVIHRAVDDSSSSGLAGQRFRLEDQDLPANLFGTIPRAWVHWFLKPLAHDPSMRWINRVKFWLSKAQSGRQYRQSLAAFNFLLDYIPQWKKMYKPGGMIQYQFFIPKAHARRVFQEALQLQRQMGVYSFLGVVKRHRADDFIDSYSVDGYSLALDFPITRRNAEPLARLVRAFDLLTERYEGKIYLAKDSFGRMARRRDQYSTGLTAI